MASGNVMPSRTTQATALTLASDHAPERELRVILESRYGWWEYRGTRAQLEAEGVVPPGVVWPEDSRAGCRWQEDRREYWLRRTRPEGLKGPANQWKNGDWWFVRCSLRDGMNHATHDVLEKKRELELALYRHSPEGQREAEENWRRYWAAHKDRAFQAFKATLLPPRKKPGRKSKQDS